MGRHQLCGNRPYRLQQLGTYANLGPLWWTTQVFHPNVSTSGDICVNVLKRDWTPETTLRHVFMVSMVAACCCCCSQLTGAVAALHLS